MRDDERLETSLGETTPERGALGALVAGAASPRPHYWKTLAAFASVALFAFSIFVLVRILAGINFTHLRAAVAATSADQIALGCLFTAISYLALTGYDALALRQLRLRVPYLRTALASFTSYAISFTLGFPIITGGTVRYWVYSQSGISAAKVASLTLIAGVTFWLGIGMVIGLGLTMEASALAEINHLKSGFNIILGLSAISVVLVYLYWVSQARRRVRIQGFHLELPGPRLTLAQMLIGMVDVCSGAAVLFVLLPADHGLDFITFASVYAFACLLGIASHAPGGIGVFEATMLKALPGISYEALFASLLLFRVIYYLVPFVFALALIGATESRRRWRSLRDAIERSRDD
jgi:uncharacterized membrane protein YbhN (UPF0104 family)